METERNWSEKTDCISIERKISPVFFLQKTGGVNCFGLFRNAKYFATAEGAVVFGQGDRLVLFVMGD